MGDVWIWTAICADSKLAISWLVGNRDADAAARIVRDLEGRLANRVQLTTDGLHQYLHAVQDSFGWNGVDYAMLVKICAPSGNANRYSTPRFIRADRKTIMGNPDEDHVSTSFIERSNLTLRMQQRRFTRLTNAFSKKVENHAAAVSLHFMWYNFARPHQALTKRNRGIHTTPAMAARLTDRVWTAEDVVHMMKDYAK
jgi:IS1 family transposase